jgi:intracellular sulfur oxidation DsrE/DsrF family protein
MKKLLLITGALLSVSLLSYAQTPYNVVFDLTSGDTTVHKSVIRWLNGITSTHPDAKLEVVLYGQSLPMVTRNKSTVEKPLQDVLGNKNISFKVCESAMKRHQLDKSQLLPGIGTVPDGIYEIVAKQSEGWGYIKAAQ